MSSLGTEDTKPILQELEALGLDNDTYRKFIHHAGHSIADMMGYDAGKYRPDSRNIPLHWRLVWILKTYRDEWKLPPGRKDVFEALAKASKLGIT
jgi:hypothetical protein